MSEQNKRIYVTVDVELEQQLNRLKQTEYYAKTHAEMVRYLIKLGLNSLAAKPEKHQE